MDQTTRIVRLLTTAIAWCVYVHFIAFPAQAFGAESGTPRSVDLELEKMLSAPRISSQKEQQSFAFDYVPNEALETLPFETRPEPSKHCSGVYWSPPIAHHPDEIGRIDAPLRAEADQYNFDQNGPSVLKGNVVIQQGNQLIASDQIEISPARDKAALTGNVVVRYPGAYLQGDSARLNLANNTHSLSGAHYVVHEAHARGSAGSVTSYNQEIITLKDGTYTACPPDDNTWMIKGNEIELNQTSGWGEAWGMSLRIKDVPVIYLPWINFPINDERKTGLLFPSFGHSNDGGLDVSVPLYVNIAPQYDATLTSRHIEKRGTHVEIEGRYLHPTFHGTLGGAYLSADKLFDEQDRKLISLDHAQTPADNWSINADYTRVSDTRYFDDLGTDLAVTTDSHLIQAVETSYESVYWRTAARMQSFQTIDETVPEEDLPSRKLPELTFNSAVPIGMSGWEIITNGDYNYFERNNEIPTDVDQAHRFYLESGLRYRLSNSWGFLTPTGKIKHVHYNIRDGATDEGDTPEATIGMASLDAGLYFDRDIFKGRFTQTLEPRLFGLYTDFDDQNNHPVFDTTLQTFSYGQLFREDRFVGHDRLGDTEQVSAGLTTRFLENNSQHEYLRASIGRIFYSEDRRVQLDNSTNADSSNGSSIAAELRASFSDEWIAQGDIQWNPDINLIERGSIQLQMIDFDWGVLNTGYRYRSEEVELGDRINQSDIGILYDLNSEWKALGRWYFDLEEHRSLEALYGLEYESCCWRLRLTNQRFVSDSGTDVKQRLVFQIQFKGLGDFGTGSDKDIEQSIPGFKRYMGEQPLF